MHWADSDVLVWLTPRKSPASSYAHSWVHAPGWHGCRLSPLMDPPTRLVVVDVVGAGVETVVPVVVIVPVFFFLPDLFVYVYVLYENVVLVTGAGVTVTVLV